MLAYGFLEAHLRAFVLLTICLYLPSCSPSQQASSTVKAESAENKGGEDESEDDELEQEGVLVQAPKAGSPEAVVQGLIAAAMYPSEEAGWEAVQPLLHSSISAPAALKKYRQMNYATSRRKVALFTPDDTKPHFRVVQQSKLSEDEIKLFVHNEQSMPTPCTLKRDAQAEGAWRVYVCSL